MQIFTTNKVIFFIVDFFSVKVILSFSIPINLQLKLSGLNSGSSIIKAPDSGSTGVTFTLPASAGTLVTSADVPITTTATSNIGLGANAVDSITTGDYNVGLGDNALTATTEGSFRTMPRPRT